MRNSVRLRDTFAGKNLTTFLKSFSLAKFLTKLYRQKCRADIPGSLEAQELILKYRTKINYN